MYVCMYVPLANAWMVERNLMKFGIKKITHSEKCLASLNVRDPKIGAFQTGPKILIGDFLKTHSNDFYYTAVIYRDHRPK
jgi:hypothetical protein